MQNYHLIFIRYIGPSDTRGSRIVIRSEKFEQSTVISIDHRDDSITPTATRWLTDRGFNIIGMGETRDGYALISDTFKPIKD